MKKISSADEIFFNCGRNFFRLRTKFGWTADEIRMDCGRNPALLHSASRFAADACGQGCWWAAEHILQKIFSHTKIFP